MGLIRTKTYIKYAGINLKEAEAALQKSSYEKCARKVFFCTDALIKAVAAALPMVKTDFFNMTSKQFAKNLEDLADNKDLSHQIARNLFEARDLAKSSKIDRIVAETALGRAGAAFTELNELFA